MYTILPCTHADPQQRHTEGAYELALALAASLGDCWAWLRPIDPATKRTVTANFKEFFTEMLRGMNTFRMCRYAAKVKSLGGLLDRVLVSQLRLGLA